MDDAVSAQGAKMAIGFRDSSVCSGSGHVYLPHHLVESAVKSSVDKLKVAMSSENRGNDGAEGAGQFFYQLIHLIHPFINGNGSLGKLLLSRVLMQSGVPFPVPLLYGHRQVKKHCENVVVHYARTGSRCLGSIARRCSVCSPHRGVSKSQLAIPNITLQAILTGVHSLPFSHHIAQRVMNTRCYSTWRAGDG